MRPYLLRHKSLTSYLLVGLVGIWFSQFLSLNLGDVLGYATNIFTNDLTEQTNQIRAGYGLGSLTYSEELSSAAKAKAEDMFDKDYWAHNSPDGKEPWDFIIAAGYDYSHAGENLAVDFNNSENVVKAWEASPTHKANLVNPNYTEIGFSVMNGQLEGRNTTLVVQMFGRPRNLPSLSSNNDGIAEVSSATDEIPSVSKIQVEPTPVTEPVVATEGKVLNAYAIFSTSKYIAIILGLFLTLLFSVDYYYMKRIGEIRLSAHTLMHILLLVLVIAGIWYTSIGIVI